MSQDTDNFENLENIEHLAVFNVKTSFDKMFAYVKVKLFIKDAPVNIKEEHILNELAKHGIIYGIDHEEIARYCDAKDFNKELRAAKGTPAIQGTDGFVEFFVDVKKSREPKENDEGKIDYKNLNYIINVEKDQLLCKLIDEVEGINGKNVLGEDVLAKQVLKAILPAGKNTYISEDGNTLYAQTDGCINYVSERIEVEDAYIIHSDVGAQTGNIDFNGSVIVKGSVREGFVVRAKKDIVIEGTVEGADILSGGNILIKTGMNGMNSGNLFAEEDITVRFIENAKVVCKGCFYCDSVIKCDIKAGEDIILKGKKASVLGGELVAGRVIYAKSIGTENHIPTNITINPHWQEQENEDISEEENIVDTLEREIREIAQKVAVVDEKIEYLKQQEQTLQIKNIIKTLLIYKATDNNKMREKAEKLANINESYNMQDRKIIVTGSMFGGVTIRIKKEVYKIKRETKYKKIMLIDGEISEFELNSSDII